MSMSITGYERVVVDRLSVKASSSGVYVKGQCGKGYRMPLEDWRAFKDRIDAQISELPSEPLPKLGGTVRELYGVPPGFLARIVAQSDYEPGSWSGEESLSPEACSVPTWVDLVSNK